MAFVRPFEVSTFLGLRSDEQPAYVQIYRDGDKEFRQYQAFLVATTKEVGNYGPATDAAFERLYDYLFGDNADNAQIRYGRPIFQQKQVDQWMVSVILPKHYDLKTAPVPLDERVQIRKMPPRKVAVIEYGEPNSTETIKTKELELLRWLGAQTDFAPTSRGRVAQYDPPHSFSLFRHNEIHIDVRII